MVFDPGQDARSGAATLASQAGNGADAAARDLLFIEQLRFGQVQLAQESIFMCGLLQNSIAAARSEADSRGINITVARCDRVVSSRHGDRRRLVQAFDQLLRNAIQYTANGGQVEIRGMLSDRRFVIEIVDAGPGIPDEEQELIYDAFFRGTNALDAGTVGRGIGLTLARAIIEAHGGSLRLIANSDGAGSTAQIELPA